MKIGGRACAFEVLTPAGSSESSDSFQELVPNLFTAQTQRDGGVTAVSHTLSGLLCLQMLKNVTKNTILTFAEPKTGLIFRLLVAWLVPSLGSFG